MFIRPVSHSCNELKCFCFFPLTPAHLLENKNGHANQQDAASSLYPFFIYPALEILHALMTSIFPFIHYEALPGPLSGTQIPNHIADFWLDVFSLMLYHHKITHDQIGLPLLLKYFSFPYGIKVAVDSFSLSSSTSCQLYIPNHWLINVVLKYLWGILYASNARSGS